MSRIAAAEEADGDKGGKERIVKEAAAVALPPASAQTLFHPGPNKALPPTPAP